MRQDSRDDLIVFLSCAGNMVERQCGLNALGLALRGTHSHFGFDLLLARVVGRGREVLFSLR